MASSSSSSSSSARVPPRDCGPQAFSLTSEQLEPHQINIREELLGSTYPGGVSFWVWFAAPSKKLPQKLPRCLRVVEYGKTMMNAGSKRQRNWLQAHWRQSWMPCLGMATQDRKTVINLLPLGSWIVVVCQGPESTTNPK
jgi:hypothetical protein